jgi:hypothetical protein
VSAQGKGGLAIAIGYTTSGILFEPMHVYFGELFPREQRQTGMGIAFHISAVVGGGILPLVANRGLASMLGITLVRLSVLPETAPKQVTPPTPAHKPTT